MKAEQRTGVGLEMGEWLPRESRWEYFWNGKLLTPEQIHWWRVGANAEAESRNEERAAGGKDIKEFLDYVDAVVEYQEVRSLGRVLWHGVWIFQSLLTKEDARAIRLATRGHKDGWFTRLKKRFCRER